jgi:hypothetical protein
MQVFGSNAYQTRVRECLKRALVAARLRSTGTVFSCWKDFLVGKQAEDKQHRTEDTLVKTMIQKAQIRLHESKRRVMAMWKKHDNRSNGLLEEITRNSSFLNQLAPRDALKALDKAKYDDPAETRQMAGLVERLKAISDEYKTLPNRGLKIWDDKVQAQAENYHLMTLKDLGLRRLSELLNIQLRDKFQAIKEAERRSIMAEKVTENAHAAAEKVSILSSLLMISEKLEKKNKWQALNKILRPMEHDRQAHAYLLRMVHSFHTIYTKRVRRTFNPPIVIKDAD